MASLPASVFETLPTESARALDLSGAGRPPALHLVVAWCGDDPELTGSSAEVSRATVLGRGDALPDDPAPRVLFSRVRPSELSPGRRLICPRLSRLQLHVAPAAGPSLEIRSVGRCPMRINGLPVNAGAVGPGDTVLFSRTLLLLVAARPPLGASRQGPAPTFPFGEPDEHGFVGESPAIWELRETLRFVAPSSQHVLLLGESGSGKELAARAIHAMSGRSKGPLVARNAATLPEGLVDAELFGNVRNYPNPGMQERPGLIGEADGGTLFLDEIGEMRPDLQAHLLRVMDRGGEYQRLGEARARRADLRVIAATNRPAEALKHDVAARFGLKVRVPGLNERREDIPLLLRHLLAAAMEERSRAGGGPSQEGRAAAGMDPALMEALLRHDYTAHVRELNQLLWVALSSGRRSLVGMTDQVREALRSKREPGRGVGRSQRAPGRAEIEAALAKAGGKVAPAAKLLGLKNRYALYRCMQRFGIRAAEEG